MRKNEQEDVLSCAIQATDALKNGTIDLAEWGRVVTGADKIYSEETLRRCSVFFSAFLKQFEDEELWYLDDDRKMRLLDAKTEGLIKERKKLQRENAELQEKYRKMGLGELFDERILEAIDRLPTVVTTPFVRSEGRPPLHRQGLLAMSDFHAGSVFELRGPNGEVINRFDMDVLKRRMNQVLDHMGALPFESDKIYVACLGDYFENILRMSSLTKLRQPVVDTVIEFSEYLSQWLVRLAQIVETPIEVAMIGGNHDINRPLGSKVEFEDENLGKLVREFVWLRLKDVDGITIRPYAEFDVVNIAGTQVGLTHGYENDLNTTMEYYSSFYNMNIDHVYAGHLHRPETKTVGVTGQGGDREVIRVGSLCGTDTYAKKLRKAAQPSVLYSYYDSKGRGWNKTFYLK